MPIDLTSQRRAYFGELAAQTSDAARLATELQREFPNATRTQCLREAERLQALHGTGLVIAPIRKEA
ncbi:hypothetical protein UFOVP703_30 [uncultured Caudovirales phage]|uniref:Uncharacterized protein n=1 Tax=uncultured Caudovirales phage TaxID=2100421 RepID=A0A6J5NU87_9CAUD|nr:hypothetical protein UFOVP703_30 [uncultured Caudovirales phage]